MSKIKGYKVFNPDWTCRGSKYEVGKTYKYNGNIELCEEGFHFCINLIDCFNHYDFNNENKVAEVIATGEVETGGNKSVTDELTIIKELDWDEVLALVNIGNFNSGYGNTRAWNPGNFNSGDRNTGNWNSGNFNSGDDNSGDWNYGDRNTGNWNSGNFNSGHKNLGDYNSGSWNSGNDNSGSWNSGHANSGDWNSGDGNNGVFCTEEPKIKIFDKESDMTLSEWRNTKASQLLRRNFRSSIWIPFEVMTDEEKRNHPDCKTKGGYLKALEYKEACKNMWVKLNRFEKEVIKAIPNFDRRKFYQITGIDVREGK